MRARMLAIVAIVSVAAVLVVVAAARTTANGLPSYTNGWQKWPRINSKPFRNCGPPCAHSGVKNVYESRRRVGSKYPNGTVIVKTIVDPGTKFVRQIAVMRKVSGRWRFVEYTRSSATARYTVLGQGQFCLDCHTRVKSNDYVFTRKR